MPDFESLPKNPPFKETPELVKDGEDFDILKLGQPQSVDTIGSDEIRQFERAPFAITEYFAADANERKRFFALKDFYEKAKDELAEFLPPTFFVIGHPSDPDRIGESFYVIQDLSQFQSNEGVKMLEELNRGEFDVEFLEKLLTAQERIYSLLQEVGDDLPDEIDDQAIDPKMFKEEIVYSPENKQLIISNLFNIDPEVMKQIIGSPEKLTLLKTLSLGHILDRSAAWEFIKGENVHWGLDIEKTRANVEQGKKGIALTFDDGPNDETEKLLDILKEEGVHATFFLVGSLIEGRKHIVKRIIDEGHEVGVHEWTQEGALNNTILKDPKNYFRSRFLGPRKDLGDVKHTTELIEEVTGQRPTMGRIAGVHGTIDSFREFEAMDLKLIHAYWYDVGALSPNDGLPAETLLKRALGHNKEGIIRLFHIGAMRDTGKPMERNDVDYDKGKVYPPDETLKMIRQYVQKSRAQGYDFVELEKNL